MYVWEILSVLVGSRQILYQTPTTAMDTVTITRTMRGLILMLTY